MLNNLFKRLELRLRAEGRYLNHLLWWWILNNVFTFRNACVCLWALAAMLDPFFLADNGGISGTQADSKRVRWFGYWENPLYIMIQYYKICMGHRLRTSALNVLK
jgi:hypothetical protein